MSWRDFQTFNAVAVENLEGELFSAGAIDIDTDLAGLVNGMLADLAEASARAAWHVASGHQPLRIAASIVLTTTSSLGNYINGGLLWRGKLSVEDQRWRVLATVRLCEEADKYATEQLGHDFELEWASIKHHTGRAGKTFGRLMELTGSAEKKLEESR